MDHEISGLQISVGSSGGKADVNLDNIKNSPGCFMNAMDEICNAGAVKVESNAAVGMTNNMPTNLHFSSKGQDGASAHGHVSSWLQNTPSPPRI